MSVGDRHDRAASHRDAIRIFRDVNFARFIALALVIGGFGVASGGVTVGAANLSTVLVQSAIRGIASCGQALIILTGGLDLSVSGVIAASLMFGGSLLTSNPRFSLLGHPISPLLVFPMMLLVGAGFGIVNGYLVARFRLPALLVTLGTWQIGVGLAYEVTGSGFVDKLPQNIAFLGQGELAFVPVPVIVLFAVFAVTYFLLHHTVFGAEVYAVGGNPRCAFISGVRVRWVRVAVFAFAGLLYGVGAIISMSHYSSATMAQVTGLELSTISAVAIGGVSLSGGKGSIVGVLIGALIIGVIDNGLAVLGVGAAGQEIVKGAIILAVVMIDGVSWASIRGVDGMGY